MTIAEIQAAREQARADIGARILRAEIAGLDAKRARLVAELATLASWRAITEAAGHAIAKAATRTPRRMRRPAAPTAAQQTLVSDALDTDGPMKLGDLAHLCGLKATPAKWLAVALAASDPDRFRLTRVGVAKYLHRPDQALDRAHATQRAAQQAKGRQLHRSGRAYKLTAETGRIAAATAPHMQGLDARRDRIVAFVAARGPCSLTDLAPLLGGAYSSRYDEMMKIVRLKPDHVERLRLGNALWFRRPGQAWPTKATESRDVARRRRADARQSPAARRVDADREPGDTVQTRQAAPRRRDDGDLETVWNGARDRDGSAKSLSSLTGAARTGSSLGSGEYDAGRR